MSYLKIVDPFGSAKNLVLRYGVGIPDAPFQSDVVDTQRTLTSAEPRRAPNWLGGRDSNPDTQIQNLQSYRWTTSQHGGGIDANASTTILQLAPYYCVVQTPEEAFAEIFGQFRQLRHGFHRWRKFVYLDRAQPRFFHIKLQQLA